MHSIENPSYHPPFHWTALHFTQILHCTSLCHLLKNFEDSLWPNLSWRFNKKPKLTPTYSLDCTGLHWISRKCGTVQYLLAVEVQFSPVKRWVEAWVLYWIHKTKSPRNNWKRILLIRLGNSKPPKFSKSDQCQGKFPSWGNLPIWVLGEAILPLT